MDLLSQVNIVRIKGASATRMQDVVINEHTLCVLLNDGIPYTQLLCTCAHLQELAVGHLYTEGLINAAEDIAEISQEHTNTIHVVLRDPGMFLSRERSVRTVTTGCGAQKSAAYERLLERAPLPVAEQFDLAGVMALAQGFQSQSALFQQTGGVHACALCTQEEELFFREDIGRHNAFDKVIGAALLQGVPFSGKLLLTSGRVPSDMVIKAVYAGLPVVVSRSAPTNKAIELANAYGITLCGFARGDRMNIYSVPERLVGAHP